MQRSDERQPGSISVSIVSHGHGDMVNRLVGQLLACPEVGEILLTYNIPETNLPITRDRIKIFENQSPLGFGANHNKAFTHCRQPYFCILNPDIELKANPFPRLFATLEAHSLALVAPKIVTPNGQHEASFRYFPTFRSLLAKASFNSDGQFHYGSGVSVVFPDWIAGMFMLLRAPDFAAIGGFDERYFLYYEDVDVCARLHMAQKRIAVDLDAEAVHDARRASRRNLRHMRWHLSSMMRYLWRYRGTSLRTPDAGGSH